jgi:hypothetical protein
MFVKATETCWRQAVLTELSRFLTNESQRSSRLLKAFIQVKNINSIFVVIATEVLFVA